MTAPEPDPEWVAAFIEQKVAELDDEAFQALVDRVRAPKVPKGTVVPGVGRQPERSNAASAAIQAAEQSGDWSRSFQLKAQRLNELLNRRH